MDLLLTHGYFLHEDAKELQIMKPYAPLGLLYLSSYLRARGFAVEIYDSTFSPRRGWLARVVRRGSAHDYIIGSGAAPRYFGGCKSRGNTGSRSRVCAG